MASLSPEGERATLALIADLYAQVVDLRIALNRERAERAALVETYAAAMAEERVTDPEPPVT